MIIKLHRIVFLVAFLFFHELCFAQKDVFGLDSVQTKLVNNKGEGPDSLFGVRNMRVVLNNVLYRGGSNNFHRKDAEPKTYNSHPLPYWGLSNLRTSGFGGAIYLYSKYFDQDYPAPMLDSLKELGFNYRCLPNLNPDVVKEIFTDINKLIYANEVAPIYIHCWNGWHQSGMLSAFTLMQFCGINNQQALKYWEQNTDGNYKGFPAVKSKILEFKPYKEFVTDSTTRSRICPCMTESILKVKEIESVSEIQKEGDAGQKEMMESPTPKGDSEGKTRTHVVRAGETLSSIAKEENTSVKSICEKNNITETGKLKVGQKLIVSGYKKSDSQNKTSSSKKYYTVKSGDTLSKIASKNKTTVSKLCKLNHFKESKVLHVGEKIRLR
jgi:LysM repeat protein